MTDKKNIHDFMKKNKIGGVEKAGLLYLYYGCVVIFLPFFVLFWTLDWLFRTGYIILALFLLAIGFTISYPFIFYTEEERNQHRQEAIQRQESNRRVIVDINGERKVYHNIVSVRDAFGQPVLVTSGGRKIVLPDNAIIHHND